MFAKISSSWELVKASARVLAEDKELMVFPVVSAIGTLVVTAVFVIPLFTANFLDAFFSGRLQIFGVIALFLFYLAQYLVIFYANTALVGAALIRLRGGDPTLADGFRIANSHLGAIFGYALIAATVGMILRSLARHRNSLGRLVISLIGFAWNIATFLVVPVLVTEDIGPIEAIKRSAALLKRTWGEQIIGNFGLGAVFGLAVVALLVIWVPLILVAAITLHSVLLAVALAVVLALLLVLLGLLQTTLNGIYTAAVYRYAMDGEVGGFFEPALVQNAFQVRPA
ncbi:MAG: hypothetical protein GYA59_13225 [Chloroflexi bacterium]|nr:hypothetical protein [Chloroflexota bacterium]